jgi:hypothetical protein
LKNALTTAKKLGIAVDDIFRNSRPEWVQMHSGFINRISQSLEIFMICSVLSLCENFTTEQSKNKGICVITAVQSLKHPRCHLNYLEYGTEFE